MFKNHIKITLCSIRLQKAFALINIIGLSVSLVSCFLIFFHVKEELSYEESYPKADRLYRITMDSKSGSTIRHWAQSPPLLGLMIKEAIPEMSGL